MAIIIETDYIDSIYNGLIEKIHSGQIKTWIIDNDKDITIANMRWRNKAWFKIKKKPENNQLLFGIIPSRRNEMSKALYGIFHGRLISTLLAHFDEEIEDIRVTPGFYVDIDYIPSELLEEINSST